MHEVTYRQPFVVVNELLQTYAEIVRFKRRAVMSLAPCEEPIRLVLKLLFQSHKPLSILFATDLHIQTFFMQNISPLRHSAFGIQNLLNM